jgi:predicted lipid-binding transport protein (Tim44 family)
LSEVQTILRIASTIACGIVIAAFAMWASDEGRASSDQQIARVSEPASDPVTDPGARAGNPAAPVAVPAPEPEHGGVRGVIEDANEALLSPFDHVAQNDGPWVAHAIPALLALLTYGLLARILIAYLQR